jgi:thiamine biosynthesis lipoprotein
VTISVTHESVVDARALVEAAFAELERLEAILSRHRTGSPLDHLAKERILRDPPRELVRVLRRAQEVSNQSGGAFDVSIAPLLSLYQSKVASADPHLPSDAEVARSLSLVDFQRIRVEDDAIALELPGMAITLDGIAKGFVVDRVVQTLAVRGAQPLLVEAGGDFAGTRRAVYPDGVSGR